MASERFCFRIVSLISTCSVIGLVHTVSYGPSLVSLTRWDRFSRGPTIFNPDTGRVIALEDYPNYSVVIPLAPDNPSASSNQVFISRRVSGPGEFSVMAPSGYGVMAVIQNLDLRVADDACNDFILFSEVDGGGGAGEATGSCGKVDARDPSPSPQGLVGPRSFISSSGRMKILFYHGFIWGLVRNFNFDIFDSSLNPDLKVEIAFTAFKDCSPSNSTQGEAEPQLNDINLFAPCSPSSLDSKTCIRQELFCDGKVNCAFAQEFGSDEDAAGCILGRSILELSKSQNSPPTTIASDTITSGEVVSTEVSTSAYPTTPSSSGSLSSSSSSSASTSSSVSASSSSSSSSSNSVEEPISTELPITEPPTQQSKSSIRHYKGGTGTDSAGLIGLVRKFPHVDIIRPNKTTKTIIIKSLPSTREAAINKTHNLPIQVTPIYKTATTRRTSSTVRPSTSTKFSTRKTKMPLEGGELFVDINSNPIEDSLIDGVSKEEAIFNHEFVSGHVSPQTLVGIFAIAAIVLMILGALRVYYCYNKVIWNPHGNLKENEGPPEMPNPKMKGFGGEDIFSGKKGRKGKEQPPSYEILFPLPGEKEGSLKV